MSDAATTLDSVAGATATAAPAIDYDKLAAAIVRAQPAPSSSSSSGTELAAAPARARPTPNQGRRLFAYPPESKGKPWLALVTHEYGTENGYLECIAFPPGQRAVTLTLDSSQYEPSGYRPPRSGSHHDE